MSSRAQPRLALPRTKQAWARLYCQASALFALQGIVLLGLYTAFGFDTAPETFPLGLQLDPLHSVVHLVIGLAGAYIGFARPEWSVRFVQAFGIFYLLLAFFGTFTNIHFGLSLALPENALHWTLGLLAAVIGFWPASAGRR